MKQTVNFSQFCDAFLDYYRENKFSYTGKRAIFEYLEEQEADLGEEYDLDIIEICGQFTEFSNLQSALDAYNLGHVEDYSSVSDAIDALRHDVTSVIYFDPENEDDIIVIEE